MSAVSTGGEPGGPPTDRSTGASRSTARGTGCCASRSTATIAPRTWRSVPAQDCPFGTYSGAGRPAATQAQASLTGQTAQLGVRAVHTTAPSSITAAFHRTDRAASSGSSSAARLISADVRAGAGRALPPNSRAGTRRMWVPAAVSRRPNARAATAAAV
ncbi:hypothetical protein AC792_07750 [Arthrobacter sp. RIT-PI-e]|nr:hypothetical protein AC792_07750 [Arthrobacter sp. RIT-PI-e]